VIVKNKEHLKRKQELTFI